MAAALLGIWSASDGTGAVTTGSRTSNASSLITAAGSAWAGTGTNCATATVSGSVFTFTEQIQLQFGDTATAACINLCYNIGGSRGGSVTISKGDDGSNGIGAQEWSGVAASPTIVHNTATGSGTSPSVSVSVGAASLVIGLIAYDGSATTITAADGASEAQEIDENNDNQSCAVYYKVGQTGTPSISATLGASRNWGAIIVAFTEDGGGGSSIAAIAAAYQALRNNN